MAASGSTADAPALVTNPDAVDSVDVKAGSPATLAAEANSETPLIRPGEEPTDQDKPADQADVSKAPPPVVAGAKQEADSIASSRSGDPSFERGQGEQLD